MQKGIRDTREQEQENRIIYINNVIPSDFNYPKLNYGKNKIVTSKVFKHQYFKAIEKKHFNDLYLYATTSQKYTKINKVYNMEFCSKKFVRAVQAFCQLLFFNKYHRSGE